MLKIALKIELKIAKFQKSQTIYDMIYHNVLKHCKRNSFTNVKKVTAKGKKIIKIAKSH